MGKDTFANYVWPVLTVPAILFYMVWCTDRFYAYWFITDPDEHQAGFRAATLPENNYTDVIVKGFRVVAIDVGTQPFRRVYLAVHTTVGMLTGIAMILNLTGWIRTKSYTLHRALGNVGWAGTLVNALQVAASRHLMEGMKLGTPLVITVYLAIVMMLGGLAIGYQAAKEKNWMRHRAAMMYMSANFLFIPMQRFLWTLGSKAEFPYAMRSWEEYRDVVMGGSGVTSLIIVNIVATYFALYTTPIDKHIGAKLPAKTA